MSIQIIQAKPNPAGKEKGKDGTPDPVEILGEWVDLKNMGTESIRFSTIQVRHMLFDDACFVTAPELYWAGDTEGFFKPGQVLRIHSGKESDAHLMASEDQADADWHVYTGSDSFILSNRCGDRISATWRDPYNQSFFDWICYPPHPPENEILKRSGNLLAGPGVGMTF